MTRTIANLALAAAAFVPPVIAQTTEPNLAGLWVGEARLEYVTEVPVTLDENNFPIAQPIERPTKTFDVANIRLIIHVNGAGQANLLREVAILKRVDAIVARESDYSLVTDPTLFPEFPAQAAQRIASAVFDFGDQKATDAVQAVMDAAVKAAAAAIHNGDSQGDAEDAAEAAAQTVVDGADAESKFSAFLNDDLTSSVVDAIAGSLPPRGSPPATAAKFAAQELQDGPPGGPESFYKDGRGLAMVEAIVRAAEDAAGLSADEKKAAAQNVAASFSDIDNEYGRFLAGTVFGDMITPAADVASSLGVLRIVQGFDGTPGVMPTQVTSPDHGLSPGAMIVISESGGGTYDGTHAVTPVNADVFSIPVEFVAPVAIASYGGTVGSAPLTVNSPAHGLTTGQRIIISNAGVAAYNGEQVVTVVNGNSFTVDVVVQSPTGSNGEWASGGVWKHDKAAIEAAVRAVPEEDVAGAEALRFQSANTRYRDMRGTTAITLVVDAIVQAAVDAKEFSPGSLERILVEKAEAALADDVPRYPIPSMVPTPDYNDFVRALNTQRTETFLTSPAIAAFAGAKGAFEKKRDDPLLAALSSDEQLKALEDAAEVAAINALEDVFSAAARTIRPEVPLLDGGGGGFQVGAGDPDLRGELPLGEALDPAALEGILVLPAMHPTNPFRHRRHRDHTVGFDIVRKIRLDFDDGPTDPLDRAGFGVDRISGTYREEITKPENRVQGGLHKPLGQDRSRGLIVEGKFELNRVSRIDALNAK